MSWISKSSQLARAARLALQTLMDTVERPLSRDVLFCFLLEVPVTTAAAVSAQQPAGHVKNA